MKQNYIYNTKNPLIKLYTSIRINLILSEITASDSVLDAGCGEGYITKEIAKAAHTVKAIDANHGSIAAAKKLNSAPNIDYELANIEVLKNQNFDKVVSSNVLEHVQDPKKALQSLLKVLKPGGKLILTFPNEKMLCIGRKLMFPLSWKEKKASTNHLRALTKEDIRSLLEGTGFEIARYRKIPNFPLFLTNFIVVTGVK